MHYRKYILLIVRRGKNWFVFHSWYLASRVTPVMCVFSSLIASQALSSSSLFITSSNWARASKIRRASAATLNHKKKVTPQCQLHPKLTHFIRRCYWIKRGLKCPPCYMDGGSLFSVVVFRCRDPDACAQSDSETREELRKHADCRLLTLAV